jgi:hypothetical protein
MGWYLQQFVSFALIFWRYAELIADIPVFSFFEIDVA